MKRREEAQKNQQGGGGPKTQGQDDSQLADFLAELEIVSVKGPSAVSVEEPNQSTSSKRKHEGNEAEAAQKPRV